MGNPCTKFRNYRVFVIGVIPDLQVLDGQPVLHTEQLEAKLNLAANETDILLQESQYKPQPYIPKTGPFQSQLSKSLQVIYCFVSGSEPQDEGKQPVDTGNFQCPMPIGRDGRILNSNKWQIPFTLQEEDDSIILTIKIAKYPFIFLYFFPISGIFKVLELRV